METPKDLEEWKGIPDHSDYEVSNMGRVRCVKRRRYLKPGDFLSITVQNTGYCVVSLDGYAFLLHRIVCAAFNGDPPSPKHEVAHNNGVRTDCRADNLRWDTHVSNCADVKKHGTANPPRGEVQGRSKLTAPEVIKIRALEKTGLKQQEIADLFGVPRTTISAITNRYNWRHI